MATDKKKIEKRWHITRYNFNPTTRELMSIDTTRTNPMTQRKALRLIQDDLLGADACWSMRRAYK